ncbi:E3 ubiquitin-protein ligase SH3RF1 isoform X3 [Agrilus planipennis]|nr:E3 ubiquitin-protein ligase SH3RF1 isoform X3 [Agrilus planipennis]
MRILEGIKSTAPRKDKQNVNDFIALKDLNGHENYNSKSTTEDTQLSDATGFTDPQTYFLARAEYDYIPKESSGLEIRKDDLINVKKQVDQNWFYGECNGREGLFPANYVLAAAPLPSSIPQCKALYDFHMENDEEGCLSFNKGEVIIVIRRVDENWAEGRLQDKIGIFPLAFVELNSLARSLINLSIKVSHIPNKQQSSIDSALQILNHGKLQEEKKRHKNEFLDPPQSHSQQLIKKVDDSNFNVLGTIVLPSSYIALFSYKPQKPDELELKKGETYIVTERCQDGWFKGVSRNTQKSGVFPGNYITPFSQALKGPYMTNLGKKNKLKYSNCTKHLTFEQSLCGLPPELPPRCSTPSLNTNSRVFIQTSQTNNCTSANSVKAPITTADVFNVGKSDDKNGERLDKGTANFISRLTISKRSKSPPATLLSIDNPGFEDNIASGTVLSSTHVRSGSCPSKMPQISTLDQSHSKNAGSMISQRLKHREQLSLPVNLSRCEEKENKRRLNSKNHRKSNSLDIENNTRTTPAQCKGDRYRCIVPYPPNTEYELELQVNDIVYVLKKRDDGWYKGTQQRTGRTGLFPASFVEKL